MSTVRVAWAVDLPPGEAWELWTDLSRWRAFVDGFGHVDRVDDAWPASGSKLVWRSVPTGRGVVTERVTESEPGVRFATTILEERIAGTQTVDFGPPQPGDAAEATVAVELDYELQKRGPIEKVVDVLFIRRAQRDALMRTLRRFATEAAEQAAL